MGCAPSPENCRFEHPPRAGQPQSTNRFAPLGGPSSQAPSNRQDLPYSLNPETIQRDLSAELPPWILSSYGPGKDAPEQLFGGFPREQSFEEVRLHCMQAALSGNPQPALAEIESLYQNAQQQIQHTLANIDSAIQFIIEAGNKHPNRVEKCRESMPPGGTTGEFAKDKPVAGTAFGSATNAFQSTAQSNNPFGAPAANTGAFGQSSSLGPKPSPFGAPTFGQPSQPATTSAFGQPATLGITSAFGRPAQPAGAFGQTSTLGVKPNPFGTPAFGQPSQPASGPAFGQPSQPAATPAFGQPSQPAGAFGQPAALGQKPNPFGALAAAPGPFGAVSQQPAASPFGQPAQTASPFGQPAASSTPANNPFGQPVTSSPFGQPTAAPANPFGQPQQQPQQPANPFGAPSAPASSAPSNPFGQPAASSPFGVPAAKPAQPAANPFGQPATQPSASPFGGGGGGGGFGNAPAAAAGTTATATAQGAKGQSPYAPNVTRQHPDVGSYATKGPDGRLRMFRGKPVTYQVLGTKDSKEVPVLRNFDGSVTRIWFPDGPPNYTAETEAEDPRMYEDAKVQQQWGAFMNVGAFEGGVMPEVPPKREYCAWNF